VSQILPPDEASIGAAADVLRRGGLIGFPTETVYGLGADAENEAAVRAMFAAKGRPPDHPVIVHLADASLLSEFAAEVPPLAWQLAAAFWPGPLTLVLARGRRTNRLVTGGLDTVGLRVPAHPVARRLLQRFGGAVAAPSANRFGRVSPTRAEHVAADLEGLVDLILDGGECQVGLESTIVDLTGNQPAVLRPGGITSEQIAAVAGGVVTGARGESPRVSGSMPSHYAPRARVELVNEADGAEKLAERARELAAAGKRVAVLGRDEEFVPLPAVRFLQLPESAEELAHELYGLLRRVDELGCEVALVRLPKAEGLGVAIGDRLRRAAGPREG
jgi:L-threonylcarbamoyladenylate synthase